MAAFSCFMQLPLLSSFVPFGHLHLPFFQLPPEFLHFSCLADSWSFAFPWSSVIVTAGVADTSVSGLLAVLGLLFPVADASLTIFFLESPV